MLPIVKRLALRSLSHCMTKEFDSLSADLGAIAGGMAADGGPRSPPKFCSVGRNRSFLPLIQVKGSLRDFAM